MILWLLAMISIQGMSYAALAGLAAVLAILSPKALAGWLRLILRARWLLLSLWLIFSYNVPGEALLDIDWAPTHEGVAAANLHGLRLVLMLGALAAIQSRLGRDGLVSALWGCLQPLGKKGFDVGRLVVRLSLVLENAQGPLQKGEWKKMLTGDFRDDGPEVVHISLPQWSSGDALGILAGGALLIVAMVL